jgi:hypothetical protein
MLYEQRMESFPIEPATLDSGPVSIRGPLAQRALAALHAERLVRLYRVAADRSPPSSARHKQARAAYEDVLLERADAREKLQHAVSDFSLDQRLQGVSPEQTVHAVTACILMAAGSRAVSSEAQALLEVVATWAREPERTIG